MQRKNLLNRCILILLLGFSLMLMSLMSYGSAAKVDDTLQKEAAITSQIKAKYALSPILKATDIHIETRGGVVKLIGAVDTRTQYDHAIMLAQGTENVTNVDAQRLKIKGSIQPLLDTTITAQVKAILLQNNFLHNETADDPWGIRVETSNGTVYLTGEISSLHQRNEVIDLVESVRDVKSVKSMLVVKE